MNESLTGTWELESFEIDHNEKGLAPWGAATRGLLIYSDSGHMSVSINRQLDFNTKDKAQRTLDSLLFYAGTYMIEGNTVRHLVTIASDPKRVGKEMIRYAELSEGKLKLTTTQESFGKAIVVWRRPKK